MIQVDDRQDRTAAPCRRRTVLSLLLAAPLVLASLPAADAGKETHAERPNIVFAFADDWGRCASAYAALEPGGISDVVSTPNFDRVAAQGVLFRNAFVNAPSCTPCRSSLLSGQYFWRTGRGAILQGAVWDDSIPTYPLMLKAAGYHIGFTHKVWSPGTPADAPFGGKAMAYNKAGNIFNGFSQYIDGQLKSSSPRPEAETIAAAKQKLLEVVRSNFRAFLNDREPGQPLCYWFGPTNVHRKWIKGSGRQYWAIDPDDLQGKMPPFLPDVPEVRQDMADYLGEVQAFDAGLGVIMEELNRIGELDNTLLAVSGDHGAPGFPNGKCNLYDFGVQVPLAIQWAGHIPPGRVVDDFTILPDLTPTFLEAAGVAPADTMTAKSLLPILTSSKSGQIDPARDAAYFGRERHVADARNGNLPYPQRAIRTRDFLYIRNFEPDRYPMGIGPGYGKPASDPWPDPESIDNNTFAAFADLDASPTKTWLIAHRTEADVKPFFDIAFGRRPGEELFDLRSDPHQMTNVADVEAYAATKMQLSNRLMTLLKDSGDPRVTGDGLTFEKPPFIGGRVRR